MEANELYKKLRYLVTKNTYFSQVNNKEDRDTIINNSFINIWTRINNGELSKEWDEIKGYCFISLKNNTLEHLRKVKKMNSNVQYMDEINTDIEDVEEESYDLKENIDKIKALIENPMIVSELQKQIILGRLKGLRYEEIAKLYNISIPDVNNNIRSTIKRLRKHLGLLNGYKTKVRRDKIYIITNVNTNETTTYTNKSIMGNENNLTRKETYQLIKNGEYKHFSLVVKIK